MNKYNLIHARDKLIRLNIFIYTVTYRIAYFLVPHTFQKSSEPIGSESGGVWIEGVWIREGLRWGVWV